MKKLLLPMLFLILYARSTAQCCTDTTISCLIYVNDEIIFPAGCGSFTVKSADSSIIPLDYHLGYFTMKAASCKALAASAPKNLSFHLFYNSNTNNYNNEIIMLNEAAMLFTKHKYIVFKIYDTRLKKYRKKYGQVKGNFIADLFTDASGSIHTGKKTEK